MSIVKDIGQLLQDNSTAVMGTDLFLSQMPEAPDEALALYETGGGGYDAITELHTAGLSVRARSGEYETAYEMISDVANMLSAVGDDIRYSHALSEGVTVNGNTYLRIKPEGEPYPLGYDSNERAEFAQSFSLIFIAGNLQE